MVCDKVEAEAAEEYKEVEEAGYRIKNKNPTRRCEELKTYSVLKTYLTLVLNTFLSRSL